MPFKPIYMKEDERGNGVFALAFADFEQIRQGYGCPHCLAGPWEHAQFGKCPDCKREMNEDAVAPLPYEWARQGVPT